MLKCGLRHAWELETEAWIVEVASIWMFMTGQRRMMSGRMSSLMKGLLSTIGNFAHFTGLNEFHFDWRLILLPQKSWLMLGSSVVIDIVLIISFFYSMYSSYSQWNFLNFIQILDKFQEITLLLYSTVFYSYLKCYSFCWADFHQTFSHKKDLFDFGTDGTPSFGTLEHFKSMQNRSKGFC